MTQEQIDVNNLDEIVEDIETSGKYFKPKSGQTYILHFDAHNKIEKTETPFKDISGKPVYRYQFDVVHPNNGRHQLWGVSKTTCLQIINQLKQGHNILKVTRQGDDRTTKYEIEVAA